MGRLYHRLINVVHDELVFEVPQDDAEEAAGREYLTCVPVIVEVNAGAAWEK